MLPTPHELVRGLDRVLYGQTRAKRALALAVYRHLLGLVAGEADHAPPAYGRQHALLLGPTGSGKTFLVRELAKLVSVPVAFCTATSLVEAGYVGEQVSSLATSLLAAAGGDVARAERGIIVIDEIDKVRRAPGIRDVSGEGVQNSLLSLLDGVGVTVGRNEMAQTVHTHGVLFLCTGAFVGLAEIVRKRLGLTPEIGFAAGGDAAGVAASGAAPTTDDLVAFGLIPEFVGRFTVLAPFDPLREVDLVAILTNTENSALRRCETFLGSHGVQLEFARGAVRAVARKAAALGTGARGLERTMADVLEPITWSVLGHDRHVEKVRVTKSVVEQGTRPTLFFYADAPDMRAARELRERAVTPPVGTKDWVEPPKAVITSTAGWPDVRIRRRLREVMPQICDRSPKLALATLWWEAQIQQTSAARMLRVAEELIARRTTLTSFYEAALRSQSTDSVVQLRYLDYALAKHAADQRPKTSGEGE